MLELSQLLEMKGFDLGAKVKFVRHKDKRLDLDEIYTSDREKFEEYQSYQSSPVFEKCKYIISFIGLEGTSCKFIGIYEVKDVEIKEEKESCSEDYFQKGIEESRYRYVLVKMLGFEEFENRVIIEWGPATLAWHQWLNKENKKEITAILPKNFVKRFTDYYDVRLSYANLRDICNKGDSEWREKLSAVAGIYLILDTKTGLQYVGSAYGKGGIWSRWKQYAKNTHGGNKRLKELVQSDPHYGKHFSFSILRTLDKSLTKNEVIIYERKYKEILGSRAFGLNSN